MSSAWRHWYHCTLTAYGNWLPGDPRGWREQHHRRHVDGDYRHPPPPSSEQQALHRRSRLLLKHPPTRFTRTDRPLVGRLLLKSLSIQRIPVISLAVAPTHSHLLIRCLAVDPELVLGRAKQNVTRNLPSRLPGYRLWAKNSHIEPVHNRSHQLQTFRYILAHAHQDAWTWSFRDFLDPL